MRSRRLTQLDLVWMDFIFTSPYTGRLIKWKGFTSEYVGLSGFIGDLTKFKIYYVALQPLDVLYLTS